MLSNLINKTLHNKIILVNDNVSNISQVKSTLPPNPKATLMQVVFVLVYAVALFFVNPTCDIQLGDIRCVQVTFTELSELRAI